MKRSRQLQHLVSLSLKPLLLFICIILLWRFISPSNPNDGSRISSRVKKHLIIASTTSSNLTWLSPALSRSTGWDSHIYITDDPKAQHTVPVNKGNEAMVYLTYIIENWGNLPDIMFFHHDHERAWHQIFTSPYELTNLNPASVIKHGYLSPRCLPGCENKIILTGEVAPLSDIVRGTPRDIQISSVLYAFLKDEFGDRKDVPEQISAPCCAQFAVSRAAVEKRGLDTWKALRDWLVDTELDPRSSGRVLEYTWHLWFGKEAEFCPDEQQCLCDVYGVGECVKEL